MSWRPLGPSRGPLGAVLKASWVMGPSWRPLGQSWGDLGGLMGRRGRPESRNGEYPNIVQNLKWKPMIFASGAPLGDPLGFDFGRLEGALGRLGAFLGVFGPFWDDLETVLSSPRKSDLWQERPFGARKSAQNQPPDPSRGPNAPVFRAGCGRSDEGGPRRPAVGVSAGPPQTSSSINFFEPDPPSKIEKIDAGGGLGLFCAVRI